ncbi:MAG: HalOD1 output domain-containing protein [Halobacteriota archaeon]|uniref:HalOD1 output domain-containing protein n=1 Tax=Natronomonas sp. TaxID=2184060 RepID=UPI0039754995
MVETMSTVSERVIRGVSTADDSDPVELPPLYDAIDPEALDAVVKRMSDGAVSFVYAGYEVTVESDGTIDLGERPVDAGSRVPVSGD